MFLGSPRETYPQVMPSSKWENSRTSLNLRHRDN